MVKRMATTTDGKIVVVITGDPVPEVRRERGDFGAIFAEAIGEHAPGYRSIDARIEPVEVADEELVVITGSSANVHKREPWMLQSEDALRDIVARGVPTLGICFGHQLLAQALGGDVQKNPRGREISTVEVTRRGEDPLVDFLPRTFLVNACHKDTVVELPPGAEVLGDSPLDPHQVLRFTPRCYGVQFHPEWDDFIMRAYVAGRYDAMVEEGIDAEERKSVAQDTPDARRIFRVFLERMTS